MRIKHIKTTKEGEPMANPEMEYPIHGKSCEYSDCKCEIGDPCEAEKKYHSGLLPFEDIEKVKDELFHQVTGGPQVDVPFNVMFKPDTLIPVELEVEVGIIVCDDCPYKTHPCPEGCSKKSLRIKP